MPDITAGALVQLDSMRTLSLATRAEVSPLIGSLSLCGDVLTVLCLGER